MRIAKIAPQGVESIRSFRLEVPTTIEPPSFDFVPGQFLQVHTPAGESSYFAIASAPGEPYYELLVKRAQGASKALFELPIGTVLDVVEPQGRGFPLTEHAGRDVLLIGVGTGIAPLRSVLWWTLSRPEAFGRLILLYGVLTPPHWCYRDDFQAWRHAGVDVRVTVTSGDASWTGPVGFVQDLLPALDLAPSNTVACLVGMKDMINANTAWLKAAGIPSERILLNF